jgi:hypothetical protein
MLEPIQPPTETKKVGDDFRGQRSRLIYFRKTKPGGNP